MTPENYQIIKNIIAQLIQLPVNQQQAFIDDKIQQFPDLKDSIKDLIHEVDSTENDLLEKPAIMSQASDSFINLAEQPQTVPSQIKQYSIIKKIGSGGMGHVYLAQQEFPAKREVAIKLLKKIINQQQLIDETQILAQLNHPNIATLYEVNKTDDEQLFIVMELIKGDDIVNWCEHHQYSIHAKIKLFQQLCEGIGFAHQKGIIHCDIKPSNIRVTEINHKAVVKIIDFGISQFEQNQNSGQTTSGTPAYLCPEVLEKRESTITDTSRDIYALGVLLYKLLTGKMPDNATHKDNPLLKNNSIAKDLQAIINKAMAYDKSRRYISPVNLSNDLSRYLNKQVVLARDNSFWYVAGRFIQRRYGLVFFTAALLATLIGGYIVQAKQAKIAIQQANIAIFAQKQAQRAEKAAKIALTEAEELSKFLTDLFNMANPERKQTQELTAQDLIDKANDKLLAIEHPSLSDARFMHTISDIYTRMGQLDKARLLSEKSLKLKKSILQENNPAVITEIIQLGLIHRKIGNSGQSENNLKQAIDLLNSINPIDKSQLAFVHNHLGNLYWQTEQKEKSVEQHKQAINLRKESGETRLLADSYNNIAAIYKRFYQWDLANKYTQMALKLYQQEYGDRHPYIALIKHNISAYLVHQYKWDEAEKLLLEALSIFTEVYGEKHNNTLNTHFNLAQNHTKRMHFDKAIDTWNIIIENYKSQNKTEKEAKFRSYLGLTLSKAQRNEEAIKQHQLSLEMSKNISPKQKNFKAKLLSRYARTLIATKLFDKAKTLLTQAIELIEKDYGKKNYERLFVLNILADVYYQENKRTQALETYQKVLESNNNDDNLNQKEQIKAYLGTGIIMLNKQQYAIAEQNFQEALTINKKINGEQDHTNSLILFQMGKLQMQLNNPNAAQKFLNLALEMQKIILPPNHPDLLLTKSIQLNFKATTEK